MPKTSVQSKPPNQVAAMATKHFNVFSEMILVFISIKIVAGRITEIVMIINDIITGTNDYDDHHFDYYHNSTKPTTKNRPSDKFND